MKATHTEQYLREKWKDGASCRKSGYPTSWFFDDYEKSVSIQLKVDSLCAKCPVQQECANYAAKMGCVGGVFGRKYIDQNIDEPKLKEFSQIKIRKPSSGSQPVIGGSSVAGKSKVLV